MASRLRSRRAGGGARRRRVELRTLELHGRQLPGRRGSRRLDLRPDVKAKIIADISKSVQELPILTLGKTLMTYQINDTKAGLYYAVEFSAAIGARPFEGKRFMARGGSVDVEVEYTDSASGFWRIGVYLTPTGP